MSEKRRKFSEIPSSPRLIPEWKDFRLLINNILKDIKVDEESKDDAVVLSDWPETVYQESHHPQNKPLVCFYSIDVNYFVSLNWVEQYGTQMQVVLWTEKKDTEMKEMITKMKFHVTDQVPPIQAMVHTGSYHTLIAYCGDMRLRLFGDHHQAFTSLGTVPCRFSISCLCYDSETEMLLSGTLGAIVTWFISPNGRGLQMAQTVPMPGHEFVQGISLNGPRGSPLARCENVVRVFTRRGQGQLKEVKTFVHVSSGSSITCSFTCVSQGTFYAGNGAGEIHAWGLDKGNFLHSFQAHSASVICVHSRPDIYTLLTAGREGMLREWNLASGNLLRQLSIDEDLQQLQFIDNTTFFCQSTSTFSLHHLPYFYSLFNVCGSAPQKMQRVSCGHNWTRILCATEDGLLRFLSPVTGELLVVTWPLLVMDKAVAWAYDADREELFVATGGPEVLVFDVTRSPCTAKYLVYTSENPRDKVKCLAYGRSHLGMGLKGLMFCGHETGIVRILSHYSCARTEKTVHSGAVLALSTLEEPRENLYLCSYGKDNTVHLTEAVLRDGKVILQPVGSMLCVRPLKHMILLPGLVGAITENSCLRLWRYQDLMTSSESGESSVFGERKCLHACAITSFDVCLSLKLFVTGATDGSVRIWDFCGRLVTELDSALHFGPLCFANNRGDLLLTFNQSIYIVSCLKLFSPVRLIHLGTLNVNEIQEAPKPFLPSFFFLFEMVFIPKFVYLGQGLQKLQGLETLVNKRVIAFDNTVPHVAEEGRRVSLVTKERPKLRFLEDEGKDLSTLDPKHKHPFVAPAQLQLAGWDGLNTYRMLQYFFGQGQQWPLAPDCYVPNSVIRACLWPKGTPVFLRYDLCLPYQDKDRDMTQLLRPQALSPVILEEEKVSRREKDEFEMKERTSFGVLESVTKKNWMGRRLSEGLIHNLIETILNLTVYCTAEKYNKYFNVLAHIFATYQISPRLLSDTVCRLLKDTAHYDSHIRELAWEMLEKLGVISHLFAIPLAIGLMDSDKNVRTKALYLMTRYTGIQTKTMLTRLLVKPDVLHEMQKEIIGEASLTQLLGIRPVDIQCLLTHVQQRLNENLTLSHKDKPFTFSFDMPREDEVEHEATAEQIFIPLSQPKKIIPLKEKKRHVQAKNRTILKKAVKVTRKHRKTELRKARPVLVSSEDTDEQREARKSGQTDTQDVVLEPQLPLSPVKSQADTETKEVMLDKEATEAPGIIEATDQQSVKVVKVTRKHRKTELRKVRPVLVSSEDTDEQREARKSGQTDTQDVVLEPQLPLSPVKSQVDTETKEVMLDKEATEAPGIIEATDQQSMKDEGEVIPKLDRQEHLRKFGKGALKRGQRVAHMKWKKKRAAEAISEVTTEEPKREGKEKIKEEVQLASEPEKDTMKKPDKHSRGLAGMPGRVSRSDARSWRDDICSLVTSRIVSSQPGIVRDLGQELVDVARVMLADRQPSWELFQEICPFLKPSSIVSLKSFDGEVKELFKPEKMVKGAVKDEGTLVSGEQMEKSVLKKGKKISPKVKRKKIVFLEDDLGLEKRKFKKAVGKVAKQKEEIIEEERKLIEPEEKSMQGKGKLTKDIKQRTHPELKMAWKKEILVSSQGKLVTGGQQLVLKEKALAREERKPLGKRKKVIWKEEMPSLESVRKGDSEEITRAHEEDKRAREESLLFPEKKLDQEEKLGEEEEELGWEEEELILGFEEQVGEMKKQPQEKKHSWGKEEKEEEDREEEEEEEDREEKEEGEEEEEEEREEKEEEEEREAKEEEGEEEEEEGREEKEEEEKEEEAWEVGTLVQDHLSGEEAGLSEEERKALKRESLEEEENKLAQEKKKWSVKEEEEVDEKKQMQEKIKQLMEEDEQEKQDLRETKVQKKKKDAKEKKRLARKRKKRDLEEDEEFGEMKKLSQEGRKAWTKARKARREARRAQKEAKTTEKRQKSWEVDLEKEERAGEMTKWSQKKKAQAQEEKKWGTEEGRSSIMGRMKLSQKVKEEIGKIKLQPRKKMKLVPEEEEMMEDWEKVLKKTKKQAMGKKERAKEEEKWVVKGREKTEGGKTRTKKKEKLALPEEKLAQKEGIQSEKEVEQKKQLAWAKEKLSLKEEGQDGEMEKQFQKKEEEAKKEEKRALEKRPTPKDSKLAEKERHTAKGKKATDRKRIRRIKRKKKITQEEKEIMKEEDKLSQEERKLAYDIMTKRRHAAKAGKMTKEEGIQATRKLEMDREISSEQKEVSSRRKNIEMKENRLLRVLAEIIKGMSPVLLRKTETTEEEKPYVMGRSEIDGHRQEFFQEQEEITKEEREHTQKERKVDDRLATKARTPTDEDSLEEDRRLLEKVQEMVLFDKNQVETMLNKLQEQNLLTKRQLEELQKRIEEREPEKTQVKWLLENVREKLLEDSYESWTEEEMKEGLAKKGKEEESLLEEGEEEDTMPKNEKKRHLKKKRRKEEEEEEEEEVSLSEEKLEENLAMDHRKEILAQKRTKEKKVTKEKERLSKQEGPDDEEKEHLIQEEEGHLSEEEEESPSEEEEEEEEESLSEEEEESLSEEEEESLSEEEEESLSEEEEESLSEEEEESLSEEEEESLSEEEEESLSEEEEESLSEEGEEEEILREEEEESLAKEEESQLTEVMLSKEERMLKSEHLKEKVGFPRPVTEDEGLAEEREGTAKRKMFFKKESLLDEKREYGLMDKSPFKIPLRVALGKKQRLPLKASEEDVYMKERQDSQVPGIPATTSSLGSQETELLEKARSIFLQGMETGLETQIPEGLHRPQLQLHDIMEPQKPEHRPKGDRWKWFLKHQDFLAEETKDQAPAPALTSSPEKPAKRHQRPGDSEGSISDEDWINNALLRLEAGEQLSRDSFRRLGQLLRDFTSKGYWKWIRLSNLKAIAKHLGQNLDLTHTDISQPWKDVLSPRHLKVIPPIRKKERERWPEPFSIPEPMLASAAKKTQTPQYVSWHSLAESYREKQAQLPTVVKKTKHLYPTRRDSPTAVHPFVDKNSLALMLQDFPALRERVELPTFSKAKKKALPIPVAASPPSTKKTTHPKASHWHLLGEPYRSARIEQLSHTLGEMETRYFYPAKRDVLTGARVSVDKQTLALMFQKDFRDFKGKGRYPKLPKLEKKTQPVLKKKEEVPSWETFVALYCVLRMLQQRYAKDAAAWMEQFHQLMDLYQVKSPRVQRLLQELLLREEPQPQEVISEEALKAIDLVPGERLFYGLFCGSSHAPTGSLKFQNVLPLSGQNKVDTIQPVGIAQYGLLELAWKSLPQVSPYCTERLPSIPPPTF